MKARDNRRRAFTLLELIVIFTVVCLLVALLIPATIKAQAKQRRISCVGRLKNIGLSYRMFATDHRDLYPWQLQTNSPAPNLESVIKHFQSISNELSTPNLLACPADTRKPVVNWTSLSQTNISYFISLDATETYPQSFLVGDRNLTTNGVRIGPGIVKIGMTTNVAWDGTIHRFQGNCTMGDGSVQQMSSARVREQMGNTGQSSMTLAVP